MVQPRQLDLEECIENTVVEDKVKSYYTNPVHNMNVKVRNGMITLSRPSKLDGDYTIVITVNDWNTWRAGAFIQDTFPHLSVDDREFIMTGITPQEWEVIFPDDGRIYTDDEVYSMSGDNNG